MTAYTIDLTSLSLGLLVGRVAVGLLMAAHGSQKLFGWFGGYGLNATGGFFEQLGFNPPVAFAAVAGLGEFASGLMVAAGFLGPVGPASMISIMIVAMLTAHRGNGVFAATNGVELPLMYALAAFVFAFAGFGRFSLDAVLGISGALTGAVTWVAVAVAAAAAVLSARLRVASERPEASAR